WGIHTQRAYESMRVRLYQFHGSARGPASFVSRFDRLQGFPGNPEDEPIRRFNSSEEAREFAQGNPNAVHGGLFGQPGERVPALHHFRLVHASEPADSSRIDESPLFENLRSEGPKIPYVKTFERVEGARIEGTGPADTEVQATVELRIPTTNQTFSYTQYARTDAQGNFEMVVPYSTTGYDEYGPEAGYANTTVRATGEYGFTAVPENGSNIYVARTHVTEGQVVGENDTLTQVTLEGQLDTNQTQDNGTAPDDEMVDDGSGEGSTDGGNGTATETRQHRGARAR
ncbi:oligosaccharyl transferase, archaeosortase A system-associated, partial [Halobacteriales archaeon QH_7_69_31]